MGVKEVRERIEFIEEILSHSSEALDKTVVESLKLELDTLKKLIRLEKKRNNGETYV